MNLDNSVDDLCLQVADVLTDRQPKLFSEFLFRGYRMVQLQEVLPQHADDLLLAKISLGSLITAVDDLADNQEQLDVALLDQVDLLVRGECPAIKPGAKNQHHLALVRRLLLTMHTRLATLPNYCLYQRILGLDLQMILLANRYHATLTEHPSMENLSEKLMFGPFNMGMVAAYTMDLMASPSALYDVLGDLRQAFLIAQRYGRISNMIHTYSREHLQKDITTEIRSTSDIDRTIADLRSEQVVLEKRLGQLSVPISTSFLVERLQAFDRLHRQLQEYI